MIELTQTGLAKTEKLTSMVRVIQGQPQHEPDALALISNATAIMAAYLDDINWIGFYILRNNELVLGPFQGKPACSRIKVGEGVCGTCVKDAKTMLVKDVDEFDGHIACDSASRSEVVVPIFRNGQVIAVLDCDSPSLDRFSIADAQAFEEIADALSEYIAQL